VSVTFAYVSAVYGGSGYAAGGWTNNACGYTINATFPAGASISTCLFSAAYSTSTGCSNTCWMSKGAFDLIGPCGRSPQPANFFWTCAPPGGNAPGTCSGINYAAPELTSCLVPSCAPTPVAVTLRLFRNFCVGSGTCDNTCIRLNPNSYSITLQGNTVQGTVTSSSTSVCAGAPAILTAHPLYGVGPYTYVWNPGGFTGSPVTINPIVNTTYTLIITDACGNTAQSISVVNILPTATANFTVTSPLCIGQTATVTYTGNGNGAATYNWNFGGATVISGSGSGPYQISWNAQGTYNVSLTVTQGSCTSQPYVQSVTVNPGPTITINPNPASICAGQTVLLTASGATTYSWSPNTNLTATTGASVTASPIANITYTVTGTSNGCTGTGTVAVVINALSTVTSTPSAATICAGGSVTLTGGGAATYSWSPSASLNSSTGTTVTATPNVTTTYIVSGTNAAGCIGFDTSIVTVNPQPIISINPSTPSICIGSNVQITASGASTYSWNLSASLSSTNIANPIASPTQTTTYTVTGTSAQGCTNIAQVTVTINTLPVVSFSGLNAVNCFAPAVNNLVGNPAGGIFSGTGVTGNTFSPTIAGVGGPYTITYSYTDANGCSNTTTQQTTVIAGANITASAVSNSICAGTSTTFLATGGQTYTWSPSIGLNSSISASPTAQPNVSTTYSVIGIDVNGCTGTASISLTVTPLPNVTATGINICSGQSGIISAAGASSYIWGPNSALNTNIGASVTASPAVTTTYTVNGTDANGCSSSATAVVTVNPLPVIGVSPSTVLFCTGASIALSASGATNYSWSPPTGLNTTVGANVSANPTATILYTVTGTDANGCAASATASLTLDPIPVASFNVVPSVGCEPLTVNFQSTSSNGVSSIWFFGDGTSGIGNTTQHTYPSGIYDVLLIASNTSGCIDSSEQFAAVTVLSSPTAFFTMDPPAPGNLPFSANLFNFLNSSTGASSYLWNFGDHTSDTSFNTSHSFTESGNYYVVLTAIADNGCTDTAQSPLIVIEGEVKPWIPSAFTPNNDEVNDVFKIYGSAIAEIDFRVFDRWGELVFHTNDLTKAWDGNFLGMKSSTDVYVYVVKLQMLSGKKYIMKGDVTLIR
jgi:gliding motility-associated-like protein